MSRKRETHTDPAAPEGADSKPEAETIETGAAEPEAAEIDAIENDAAEVPLVDPVARLEGEVAELRDQLLRALAETENLRRRAVRERDNAVKFASVPLIKDLLAVADNLHRALASVPADAVEGNAQLKTLLDGVEMTEKEFQSVFSRHDIERIEPIGKRLDPHFHEALFEIPDSSVPAGTVVRVLQAGYRLGERLIRPAQVGVAKGGPSAVAATPDGADKTPAGESQAGETGTGANGASDGASDGSDRHKPGSQYDTSV